MGFFENVRKARTKYTVGESVATLDYMKVILNDGINWAQGEYNAANGARCMVGAADAARMTKIDDAKYWIRQAIAEREPHLKTIEEFNDPPVLCRDRGRYSPREGTGARRTVASTCSGCGSARAGQE